MMPMASGRLDGTQNWGLNVEAFATTAPVPARDSARRGPDDSTAAALARALLVKAATDADIDSTDLDSLVFRGRALRTSAQGVTLFATVIDPEAGDLGPGAGHTNHLFLLADDSAGRWRPSLQRVAAGEARTVEFWRLLDHLDVDGDGSDELLVEAWRYGADNDLLILSKRGAAWREVLRLPQRWCGDPPRGDRGRTPAR